MRLPHLALAGATLATALATLVPTTAGAAADPTTHSLQYLAGHQGSDGSIAGVGPTEDTIIGAADAGYDPATLVPASGTAAFAYLTAQTIAGKTDGSAGATAKLILAVVAGHLDPTSFAGKDLVALLLSAGQFDSASGLFDPGAPGPFSQSLGILALQAAHATGLPVPTVPAAAVTALLGMQRTTDHGWGFTGSPSDTNSTALALEALAAVGQASGPQLTGALGFLHGVQQSDGGFGFDATSSSDPDSDAYVVQALVAVGEDPAAASWTKSAHTVLGNLLSFQDPASGGFHFASGTSADAFTTSQIPAALAGKPYGAATVFVVGSRIPAPPAPTPTPTPAATPTPTAAVRAVSQVPNTGGGPVAATADENSVPVGEVVAAVSLLGAGAAVLLSNRRRMRRG